MRYAHRLWSLATIGCSCAAGACGEDELLGARVDDGGRPSLDAGADDGAGESGPDAPVAADATLGLEAVASAPAYVDVGTPVDLDGSASTGAVLYQWSFGDGDGWSDPRPDAVATVTYEQPGRYAAVLTVVDAAGNRKAASVTVTATHPMEHEPAQSSSVVVLAARRVAVVSPDSDEVALFEWDETDTFRLVERWNTPREPRTVTANDEWLFVASPAGARVSLFPVAGGAPGPEIDLGYGTRPHGVVWSGDALFVSLQGTGELARVEVGPGGSLSVTDRWRTVDDPRGVARLPDGRVAVARHRSPADESRGEVGVIDPATGDASIWPLAFDPRQSTDNAIGGVPTYLDQVLVSPTGKLVALPSLQANSAAGAFKTGTPIDFQTTIRAVVSFVDVATGAEAPDSRRQFDNRGFAAAGAFSSRGDFLYLAMRGSRTIDRLDVLTGGQSGSVLDAGFAPQGLALSDDDRLLFVDAYLSRELRVYDVTDLDALPTPIAVLPTLASEPLAAEVLVGKRLFNDSRDPRIDQDQYIACAHCHLDGDSDRRVWDFTDRGEGLRNTISLLGRAGLGDGPVHWSANFDEIHDFENDIRGPFRGTGLLSDADWAAGTVAEPLGDPKAGLSSDLDALSAYVSSLTAELSSPERADDGALSAPAARGKLVFESAAQGCTSCHSGPRLTDSATGPAGSTLHDVGTLGPGSGGRLGQALTGIDTPTLHGLWHSAPYLHDGSAATLGDVLTTKNAGDRHGVTSGLAASEIDDLVAYLSSLDGRVD